MRFVNRKTIGLGIAMCLLTLALASMGKWIAYPTEEVPIDRLLKNLSVELKTPEGRTPVLTDGKNS